jgi:hypothetical protein
MLIKLDNYQLIEKLKNMGISEDNIYEFLVRKETSPLVKRLLENILNTGEDSYQLKNQILKLFFLADKMKPITCNKSTLSKITGLTERQIDERRRADVIPYIQLTGSNNNKAGRKIILFDPYVVTNTLKKFETRKGKYHGN